MRARATARYREPDLHITHQLSDGGPSVTTPLSDDATGPPFGAVTGSAPHRNLQGRAAAMSDASLTYSLKSASNLACNDGSITSKFSWQSHATNAPARRSPTASSVRPSHSVIATRNRSGSESRKDNRPAS